MSDILLTAGIACVIAAIIGGGLKAYNIEIAAISSTRRQVLLAVFGASLLVAYIIGLTPNNPNISNNSGNPGNPDNPPKDRSSATPCTETQTEITESERVNGVTTWSKKCI